jgi:hypothetical protein
VTLPPSHEDDDVPFVWRECTYEDWVEGLPDPDVCPTCGRLLGWDARDTERFLAST